MTVEGGWLFRLGLLNGFRRDKVDSRDQKRFATAMAIMGECFQKEPSKIMVDMYWKVLQDMDIKAFEDACLTLVNTRKITGTFPMVAEIREAAGGGAGAQALGAVIAWDKLMYAIQTHGPYESVEFDDPKIFHVVRALGGWIEMGNWPEEETKWKRKEFERLYEVYSANKNLPDPEHHLVGLTEANNRARGFDEHIPPVFRITGTTGNFRSEPKLSLPGHKPKLVTDATLEPQPEQDS